MIKQILPVPVLAEPQRHPTRDPEGRNNCGEARESITAGKDVLDTSRNAKRFLDSDSRGGQELSDHDGLSEWLETLPRKVRFILAMSVSALSLQRGQCRSRDDLRCFLAAAGLPVSRQAIENIECRALRKCRETELAIIAKEHLTIK